MYAVIFKAHIKKLDDEYAQAAIRMRDLARERYGCQDFISISEGDMEITISYWNDEADIVRWKQDPEHMYAQQQGQLRWYRSYTVEIAEIKRRYADSK